MNDNQLFLLIVKSSCMCFMFGITLIMGSLPIRLNAFKSNKVLLSFASAFSGGLFFAVGLLHLLPESNEHFEAYFESIDTTPTDHFPFAFLITAGSFSLILWIEKVVASHSHQHPSQSQCASAQPSITQNPLLLNQQLGQENHYIAIIPQMEIDSQTENQQCLQDEEQQFKNAISTQLNVAKRISFSSKSPEKNKVSDSYNSIQTGDKLTPYILSIAVGIHAVFEGLAIGIEDAPGACLGIAAAVACHKWAEGLTLGLAFKQAGVDKHTSTLMILIQAIMNPTGIAIGWALSDTGDLVTGIFYAISAGTFIYISTIEIIVKEFNISRYKWAKFLIFIFAIGFVSSIWFLEQLTEA